MNYYLIQNTNYEEFKNTFWEVNPEFKFTEPYHTFYKENKDKKFTSKVMWAIYLICDINSPKIRLRHDERIIDVKNYFLEDENFDLEPFKELISSYPKVVLTKIQRELKSWHDKIEERSIYIENLKYSERTAEALDKMLKESKPIWDSFDKIYKEYQEESIETRARGGREESFSEKLISKTKQS